MLLLAYEVEPVLGVASQKSADQLLKKIARKKAILIFWAILAKRGNLNLDLNRDLQREQIKVYKGTR